MRSCFSMLTAASLVTVANAYTVTFQITPLNFTVPAGQTWVELSPGFQARMRLSASSSSQFGSRTQMSFGKFDFSVQGITPTFVYQWPLLYRGAIGPSSPSFWGPADINNDGFVSCRDWVPFSVGYWNLFSDCGVSSDLNNDFLVDNLDWQILNDSMRPIHASQSASAGPYEFAQATWLQPSTVDFFEFRMTIPANAGPGSRYPIQATPLELQIGTMIPGGLCDQIQFAAATIVGAMLELRTPGQACIGDLNGDQQVDDSDFVVFAGAYNILDCSDAAMPAGCPADLNDDQFVDDSDFVIFASAYNALLCP